MNRGPGEGTCRWFGGFFVLDEVGFGLVLRSEKSDKKDWSNGVGGAEVIVTPDVVGLHEGVVETGEDVSVDLLDEFAPDPPNRMIEGKDKGRCFPSAPLSLQTLSFPSLVLRKDISFPPTPF